jgi:hypothetical protein
MKIKNNTHFIKFGDLYGDLLLLKFGDSLNLGTENFPISFENCGEIVFLFSDSLFFFGVIPTIGEVTIDKAVFCFFCILNCLRSYLNSSASCLSATKISSISSL